MTDHDDPGRFDAPLPADPDALSRRVADLEAELAAARERLGILGGGGVETPGVVVVGHENSESGRELRRAEGW